MPFQQPSPTQTISLKVKGLYTFPNDLSAIPDGSLSVADNVVIDAENVVQPRRGFDVTECRILPSI